MGPRDYMPQWADLGERLEQVKANFDVYMLGKLLWCMVSGRLKLPREYHSRPGFNLEEMFPGVPEMRIVNLILNACIVEEPGKCLPSAKELLAVVDDWLGVLRRGGEIVATGVPRTCRVCGHGQYQQQILDPNVVGNPWVTLNMAGKPIGVTSFSLQPLRTRSILQSTPIGWHPACHQVTAVWRAGSARSLRLGA